MIKPGKLRIELPKDVKKIIDTLTENGYEAYAVGGCIRDSILKREPDDWDITTNALPEQVKELFKRTVDTGIKHGTVTVMLDKTGYEVTTYRIDGEYEDGRHPKAVEFSTELVEDLKRRDFTINAMAYNEKDGLRDEFGGIGDIRKGMIRCVGNPEERFTEDALRMMRAIRFSAQLGFSIHRETMEAIKKLAPNIKKVSMERVQVELIKTLLSDRPENVELFAECGILEQILPHVDKVIKSPKKVIVMKMLKNSVKTPVMRYAALLYYAGPEAAYETLRALKLDNYTTETVEKLIRQEAVPIKVNEIDVRQAMHDLGVDFIPMLRDFKRNIYKSKEEVMFIPMGKYLTQIETVYKMYNEIVARGDCVNLKDLAVNGKDLIELGMKPGEEIGEMLNLLLRVVIEKPIENDRQVLLALAEGKLADEKGEM
ncbi:MAG: CCA tRNA nucleotidyltransferase [Thermoflexaceae bacterium]|nr:CCA tRNA nucleotidyltransferase [Thermoflexaceae bacterium]